MARPLKRPSTHGKASASVLAFRVLLPENWIVREKVPDYGIDVEIEIVEGENVTNKVLWVQLKSTEKAKYSDGVIYYSIETKYLHHFSTCRLPVALVLWIKTENQFYLLFAQRYIQEKLSVKRPNWRKQKTVKVEFCLDSKLEDVEQLKDIATEGYLYIIQQELVLKTGGKTTYWLDGIPKSDDKELKARMLKALVYMRDEKCKEAIEQLEDIMRTCTISPTERMSILLNLGNAHYSISNNQMALKNYYAILKLAKKLKKIDALLGKSAALGNIGLIYMQKGDLDTALKHHQDALKIHRKIGHRQGEASDLGNIGLIFDAKGDLDTALKHHQDALKIHRKIGHRHGEASGLINIGLIYMDKGDLDTALKHHQDALKIHRKIGHRQGEASALGNIGLIYSQKGDLDTAMKYLQDALKIDREIGHRQGEASDLGNIGVIFKAKGDLDTALKHHQDALKIHRKIGYRQGEASQLGNIGLVFDAKGDLDTALKHHQDALKIHRKIGHRHGEASGLINIGLVFKAKGDLDAALKYLQDALTLLDRYDLTYRKSIAKQAIESIKRKS